MARPLVLISGTDPLAVVSGHTAYVRAHARAVAAAGFAPHVFCVGRRSAQQVTDFGVLHRVASPLRPIRMLAAPIHVPLVAAAVASFLSRHPGPHVVHGFGVWAGSGVAASRRLAHSQVAAVPVATAYTTLEHEAQAKLDGLRRDHGPLKALGYGLGHLWIRALGSSAEGRAFAGSRVVLVNYRATRDMLIDRHGPGLVVRVIPYTSESAFVSELGEAPAEVPAQLAGRQRAGIPLIVAVSRHDPRKGIDVLLLALHAMRAAGVSFSACLVGPGPLLRAHRRLAARLGLSDSVTITGRVEDVSPYLRHADVFVLPSIQEGSGSISVLEALQAGLPIVASSCDGIPEDLADGRDALLVPPGDSAALATALAMMLADRPLRSRLAAAGRRRFHESFTPAALISALADTYADLGVVP